MTTTNNNNMSNNVSKATLVSPSAPLLHRIIAARSLTRNLAIIAHVDHGKTTFADSLLHRASTAQLSDARIGQCELDMMDEEKQRGITIQASAVSLLYDIDAAVLAEARVRARARALALVPPADLALHVANLPFGVAPQQLLEALVAALPAVLQPHHAELHLRVRANRGSAAVECDGEHARALHDALLAARDVRVGDRTARIQRAGHGPMLLVQRRAAALGIEAPTFDVSGVPSGQRRETRHAAARQWLAAHGGAGGDDNDADDDSADDSADAEDELACGAHLLVNLIDSPGHVDFSAEVSSALRVTDGAFVLVDALSGPEPQTHSVLRQALRERVRIVLVLNKVDRTLHLSPDEVFDQLQKTIDVVNAAIGSAQEPLSFANGTVAIASALEGWGATLDSVVALYGSRAGGADVVTLRRLLSSPKTAKKAFGDLVIAPIVKLRALLADRQTEPALALLEKVGRAPTGRALQQFRDAADAGDVKQLTRQALRALMPLADAVLDLAARELPSPLEAQRARVDVLAPPLALPRLSDDNDDNDDAAATASVAPVEDLSAADDARVRAGMRQCAADAPLMLFVTKQVTYGARQYALGRVLSGSVQAGQQVRVLQAGEPEASAKVTAVALVAGTGREVVRVDRAFAGNIVCIGGLPISQGTVTDAPRARALPTMQMLVSHVVGMALSVPSSAKRDGQKKLVDAVRMLTAADPSLKLVRSDEGELVLMGSGELHLEVSLSRLSTLAGFDVQRSPPLVTLREVIVGPSPRVYLGKSANKHNRIFVVAEPLDEMWRTVLQATATGTAAVNDKARLAMLREAGVPVAELRRVIALGEQGDNVLIDRCTGVSAAPLASSLTEAFHALERNGVLARGQQLTGVKLVLVDCKYHADANHRAPAQIVPAATRAFTAALLGAPIRLVEPMLAVDVSVQMESLNDVYKVLHTRRALCDAAMPDAERGFVAVHARLAVRDSLGLADDMRLSTKGAAFPMLSADGWRVVEHDPFTHEATRAAIQAVRLRLRMAPELPVADDDRL
jgi:elongation factor 2